MPRMNTTTLMCGACVAPFTPPVQRLWDMLSTKYEQCSLSRLLRFLSAQGVDPAKMDEQISQRFLEALKREGRLRLKPEVFHQNAVRAWNKALVAHSDWPPIVLAVHNTRKAGPGRGPTSQQPLSRASTGFLPPDQSRPRCSTSKSNRAA